MVENSPSDSEMDDSENSSSDEAKNLTNERAKLTSEYEKQRLARIQENKARLEALRLPSLSSSLLGSLRKGPLKSSEKGKKKMNGRNREAEEDFEYQPSEEENEETSLSEEEEEEDSGVGLGSSSRLRHGSMRKGKNKSPSNATKSKNLPVQRLTNEFEEIDYDVALKQAIALSLGELQEDSDAVARDYPPGSSRHMDNVGHNPRKEGTKKQETPGRRRKRKMSVGRAQMTEDEMIMYFFSFDEAGKGDITFRDLQRVAKANDFTWTDREILDMIDCFDSNRDGKLCLNDFRTIVSRCNMLQDSGNVEVG